MLIMIGNKDDIEESHDLKYENINSIKKRGIYKFLFFCLYFS